MKVTLKNRKMNQKIICLGNRVIRLSNFQGSKVRVRSIKLILIFLGSQLILHLCQKEIPKLKTILIIVQAVDN